MTASAALTTICQRGRLQESGKNYQPKATYPQTALANRLQLAAQLIDADLGARLFYVRLDGFDTHADERSTQQRLLRFKIVRWLTQANVFGAGQARDVRRIFHWLHSEPC